MNRRNGKMEKPFHIHCFSSILLPALLNLHALFSKWEKILERKLLVQGSQANTWAGISAWVSLSLSPWSFPFKTAAFFCFNRCWATIFSVHLKIKGFYRQGKLRTSKFKNKCKRFVSCRTSQRLSCAIWVYKSRVSKMHVVG